MTTERPLARRVTVAEQHELGLIRQQRPANWVAPEPRTGEIMARHEVIDPYAAGLPQPVQYVVKHESNPQSRAAAMLVKTSAVTIALAVFTGAAMMMLDSFGFFAWLVLASLEWVLCFLTLAVLDWREHPSAITWNASNRYLDMMEKEQAARLKALYGSDAE